MKLQTSLIAIALSAGLLTTLPALAANNQFNLVIKNHRFQPEQLTVPAGQRIKLTMDNQDATPEEFESHELDREKSRSRAQQRYALDRPAQARSLRVLRRIPRSTAKGRMIAQVTESAMLGSAIIVFREVLEAALIIAIVMGASRGVRRARPLGAGWGWRQGSAARSWWRRSPAPYPTPCEGRGQEILNAGVLLAAGAMLALAQHLDELAWPQLASDMRKCRSRRQRRRASRCRCCWSVTLSRCCARVRKRYCFCTAWRPAARQGASMLVGGALGLAAGAAVGWLVYRGLLRDSGAAFLYRDRVAGAAAGGRPGGQCGAAS